MAAGNDFCGNPLYNTSLHPYDGAILDVDDLPVQRGIPEPGRLATPLDRPGVLEICTDADPDPDHDGGGTWVPVGGGLGGPVGPTYPSNWWGAGSFGGFTCVYRIADSEPDGDGTWTEIISPTPVTDSGGNPINFGDFASDNMQYSVNVRVCTVQWYFEFGGAGIDIGSSGVWSFNLPVKKKGFNFPCGSGYIFNEEEDRSMPVEVTVFGTTAPFARINVQGSPQ